MNSCCPAEGKPGHDECTALLEKSGDRRFYHMTGALGGRRNSYEFWCECLSRYEGCYLGNSHVRPLLQVIDDSNTFQGWVGAEISPHLGPDRDANADHYASFGMVL